MTYFILNSKCINGLLFLYTVIKLQKLDYILTYHYVMKFIGYNNKYIFQYRIFNIYDWTTIKKKKMFQVHIIKLKIIAH